MKRVELAPGLGLGVLVIARGQVVKVKNDAISPRWVTTVVDPMKPSSFGERSSRLT